MIRLHPDDIKALAAEIVRQQQYMAEVQMDVDYGMTLTDEEWNKRKRKKLMRSREATK